MTDKKSEAKAKADFNLHVLLLQHKFGCSKSVACFKAWQQGPSGLQAILELTEPTLPGVLTPAHGSAVGK